MTKITTLDTLSARQSFKSSKKVITKEGQGLKKEFINRVKEIENRIGTACDNSSLWKLDTTLKFYKSTALYIDTLESHIDYLHRTFEQIDDIHWEGVFNTQKLIDENQFLKDTIAHMLEREQIMMDAWKRNRFLKSKLLNKAA